MPASSYVIYKTSEIVEKHDYLNVHIILGIAFSNPFGPIFIYWALLLACFSFTGVHINAQVYLLVRIDCKEIAVVINFSLDFIF